MLPPLLGIGALALVYWKMFLSTSPPLSRAKDLRSAPKVTQALRAAGLRDDDADLPSKAALFSAAVDTLQAPLDSDLAAFWVPGRIEVSSSK